ncbi:UDP-N-acetylglucosamine 2-epimerase (non-hydrolyzing) [Candidatus Uhrbacteria bacterium]|nr:UDP-N-acetylglucosamine 2-epimerase (non-hydrolyzing) [Candidatus Uhrbacteria bacterium]MBD3284100.1 UDP-N-acetylglucosamine 2-epimerase (non-hydrolyzing) [Candidatus Uhrbacteria bacterium]
MNKIVLLAGARPNFMKIAPLYRALTSRNISAFLAHTGQHYDDKMSEIFFRELGIPQPDVNLGIGPGDRITQTRKIVQSLTPILVERKPDAIVVVGDVTSTAAGAMAGVITGTPVVHVEAGLRSFNWAMPEELNRMIADHHSDLLLVSDPQGLTHLKHERIPEERVHFVGNIMIDTLQHALKQTEERTMLQDHGLVPKGYGLVTMHRPENVDHPEHLASLVETLGMVAEKLPLILPLHPRTKSRLEAAVLSFSPKIRVVDPLGYIDMLTLSKHAKMALTDSGGLQEETTALGIPCITLREETERPITVEQGTSEVLGRDRGAILAAVDRILAGDWKKGSIPDGWDGKTAERIADLLKSFKPRT